ncbi:MAG: 4'-phosphopantetheinyl transferase superfamily protein [Muribaculaceae bacterium]|nr:4'-phosphopantetheinyl transferase superfamily protein [Muribaculaceae bacterium]
MNVYVTSGGRAGVAGLIARTLGPDVRLLHDPDGAPMLSGSPLHISISHSRDFAAIALHPSLRIGIDIEQPRPEQLRRVTAKFLTEKELPLWNDRLLAAWTCKEAVYKAAGVRNLALGAIDLTNPGIASIPDGRRFLLNITETPAYTLTSAIPLDADH